MEENLFKTGILIGDDNFRNFAACKSEAIKIRDFYEKFSEYKDLIPIGMGKETLSEIMKWVNGGLKKYNFH